MSIKNTIGLLAAIAGLSGFAGGCGVETTESEDESVGTSDDALTKALGKTPNATFVELAASQQKAIKAEYLFEARDPDGFGDWAVEERYVEACWSYPGNIGCWIGDWLVSCEKNANTDHEWDCGAAHRDDLD